jgi:hypothetical protein
LSAYEKKKRDASMMGKAKAAFDPKGFLAKVGEGKTISLYRNDQIIFAQGAIAYNGKLEVHKSLLNMVLHENPSIKTRD